MPIAPGTKGAGIHCSYRVQGGSLRNRSKDGQDAREFLAGRCTPRSQARSHQRTCISPLRVTHPQIRKKNRPLASGNIIIASIIVGRRAAAGAAESSTDRTLRTLLFTTGYDRFVSGVTPRRVAQLNRAAPTIAADDERVFDRRSVRKITIAFTSRNDCNFALLPSTSSTHFKYLLQVLNPSTHSKYSTQVLDPSTQSKYSIQVLNDLSS